VEPPEGFFERVQVVLASARTDNPTAFEPGDLEYLKLLYTRRVQAADQALGEFRAELEELGLGKQATLIVAGTSGLDLGQHGPTGAQSLHATVTRVPLILSIPGGRGAAQAIDKIVDWSTSCRRSSSWGVEPVGVQGGACCRSSTAPPAALHRVLETPALGRRQRSPSAGCAS
jgi:hypothetical protein